MLSGIITSLIEWLICDIPGGLGRRLRRLYYRFRLAEMGERVVIDTGVTIKNPRNVRIGNNTWIDQNVLIFAGAAKQDRGAFSRRPLPDGPDEGEIVIGSDCHVAPFVVLQGHGGIEIGNSCGIASGCKVYSTSHHYRNSEDPGDTTYYKFTPMAPLEEQALISSPVRIGANCAIGLNTVLLPGTDIGEGTWIATGSVLTGKAERDMILGKPASEFEKAIER